MVCIRRIDEFEVLAGSHECIVFSTRLMELWAGCKDPAHKDRGSANHSFIETKSSLLGCKISKEIQHQMRWVRHEYIDRACGCRDDRHVRGNSAVVSI